MASSPYRIDYGQATLPNKVKVYAVLQLPLMKEKIYVLPTKTYSRMIEGFVDQNIFRMLHWI